MVVSAVIRALDVDPPHSFNALSLFVFIDVVGTPCGTPCGLQQCIVRSTAILRLIEQDVEGLFIDASLWELNLCLLLLSGVDYRRAAHLCNLPALAVKGPATNLITNHILDEKHSAIEPQRQLVKQLNVLQHVIIRVACI